MDRTDEEFDRMIMTEVLTAITKAFNELAHEMSSTPMLYREIVENILKTKAQMTKNVICAYIDQQVELYKKTREVRG